MLVEALGLVGLPLLDVQRYVLPVPELLRRYVHACDAAGVLSAMLGSLYDGSTAAAGSSGGGGGLFGGGSHGGASSGRASVDGAASASAARMRLLQAVGATPAPHRRRLRSLLLDEPSLAGLKGAANQRASLDLLGSLPLYESARARAGAGTGARAASEHGSASAGEGEGLRGEASTAHFVALVPGPCFLAPGGVEPLALPPSFVLPGASEAETRAMVAHLGVRKVGAAEVRGCRGVWVPWMREAGGSGSVWSYWPWLGRGLGSRWGGPGCVCV